MVGQTGVLEAVDDQIHAQGKDHHLPWRALEHLAGVDGVSTGRYDVKNECAGSRNGTDRHAQRLDDKETDQQQS